MTDTTPERPPARWPYILAVTLYTLAVVALLPPADPAVGAFGHDAAYLTLVADNLLAGRGYVNDAHWLVFLQPESLPMPYHNANPLYPTAMAAVSFVTGVSTISSGLLISAVSNGLLFAALLALAGRYTASLPRRLLLALGGAAFPATLQTAFELLPDALWLALTAWAFVFAIRGRGLAATAAAGALLGLSWLTRSSTLFVLPAVGVWLLLAAGWRAALQRLALMGAAAAVVASPWLIHQAAVWGNPLRGDGPFYLLQDYHAHKEFGGETERYWHSTETPRSMGQLLREEPVPFLVFVARGVPRAVYKCLAEYGGGSKVTAAVLLLLLTYAGWQLLARARREGRGGHILPDAAAGVTYALCMLLVLSVRPYTIEMRYVVLGSAILGMLLMAAALTAWSQLTLGSHWNGALAGLVLLSGAWLWLYSVPLHDVQSHRRACAVSAERRAYLEAAREMVLRFGLAGPVVVGDYPYFFTLSTGSPSLSIPQADDEYLSAYMDRYGANYIALTPAELQYWRPHWGADGVPGFERVVESEDLILFRRITQE